MAALSPRLQEFVDGADGRCADATIRGTAFVAYLENLFAVQAGDRGFNDFLSRRFTGNAETEQIHDVMCQQIEDVLARAQEAGAARPDITQADIVNLIWSNGRIIDATSAKAPTALATPARPHARRLPGRAGTPDPRAADAASSLAHGPGRRLASLPESGCADT